MTSPPPSSPFGPPGSGGFGPPPAGAGGGPGPQGFGPPGSAGFGPPVPPGGGFGAPGGFGPPVPPGPPRRGGAKVAAIVAGAVVAAALVAGGVLYALGKDDGDDGGKPAVAGTSSTPPASASASPSTGEPSPDEDPGRGAPLGGGPGDSGDEDPDPSSSASGDTPAEPVPYVVLRPGQCFDHPGLDSTVREVKIRSCDGPHDGEVIANETLTGTFATDQEIQEKALELCRADAEKRMKTIPGDRTFYYYALFPARDTYTDQGEDQVSCSLTLSADVDGPKLDEPLPG